MVGGMGETSEELLNLANAHGYDVTEHKLTRWRQAGLLRRPKQQSLGKGRGTQTVYPPGTGKQLLALCEIHAEERRLLYVAWRLWWAGYEVSFELIRQFLGRFADKSDRDMRDLKDSETGETSESALELLEQSPKARYGSKPLRRARKRVGSERFGTFMSMLFGVASGGFGGFYEDPTGDPKEDEWRILQRGFGLDRGSVYREEETGAKPADELEATLRQASSLFGEHSFGEALRIATDEDLLESRDRSRSMMIGMELIGALARQEPGSEAAKFSAMGDAVQEIGSQDEAVLVLYMLVWRSWGPLEMREKMDSYHGGVQEIVSRLRELDNGIG